MHVRRHTYFITTDLVYGQRITVVPNVYVNFVFGKKNWLNSSYICFFYSIRSLGLDTRSHITDQKVHSNENHNFVHWLFSRCVCIVFVKRWQPSTVLIYSNQFFKCSRCTEVTCRFNITAGIARCRTDVQKSIYSSIKSLELSSAIGNHIIDKTYFWLNFRFSFKYWQLIECH